jgi:large subunit ribosomal protein L6
MSRLAKKSLIIPTGVTLTQTGPSLTINGPHGQISLSLPPKIGLKIESNHLSLSRQSNDLQTRANLGSTWSHLRNHLAGVVTPWQKTLEIRGTGYKFAVKDNQLVITCGFIHPVFIPFPQGIKGELTEETKITISGPAKEVVGQVASSIRKVKPPEVYKGKGIRYLNESVKLKAGKTAKA